MLSIAVLRQIIKKCVNANDDYVLIFTGSGTTAAVHKLITCMELRGDRAKKAVRPTLKQIN